MDAGVVVALAPSSKVRDRGPLARHRRGYGRVCRESCGALAGFPSQAPLLRTQGQRASSRVEVDPDDVVYVKTREELGAHAVYSRDSDLRKMKAPVISISLDLTL